MSGFDLAFINWEIGYIAGSAAVAVFIFLEALALRKNNGKLPDSFWFHAASLLDTMWLLVSLAALYWLDTSSYALAVPVAYIIYTVFGWVYGIKLMRKGGVPNSVKDLAIPPKYISYSQSFALVFFMLCVMVMLSLLGILDPPAAT